WQATGSTQHAANYGASDARIDLFLQRGTRAASDIDRDSDGPSHNLPSVVSGVPLSHAAQCSGAAPVERSGVNMHTCFDQGTRAGGPSRERFLRRERRLGWSLLQQWVSRGQLMRVPGCEAVSNG